MTSTDRKAKASGNSFSQVKCGTKKKNKQKQNQNCIHLHLHFLNIYCLEKIAGFRLHCATRWSVEKHNGQLLTLYEETSCLMTIPYIYILQYSKNTLK